MGLHPCAQHTCLTSVWPVSGQRTKGGGSPVRGVAPSRCTCAARAPRSSPGQAPARRTGQTQVRQDGGSKQVGLLGLLDSSRPAGRPQTRRPRSGTRTSPPPWRCHDRGGRALRIRGGRGEARAGGAGAGSHTGQRFRGQRVQQAEPGDLGEAPAPRRPRFQTVPCGVNLNVREAMGSLRWLLHACGGNVGRGW